MKDLFQFDGWKITWERGVLPDGRVKETTRVHRCDSVHILAVPEPGKILLLREFRPFYGTYIWMLPSGRVDKEHDTEEAAQRELREETGYQANRLRHYCTTNATESIVMSNHVYIAEELQPSPLPQDADELIEVHTLTIDDAIQKVVGSSIVHTVSAYALLRYKAEIGG